MKNFAKFLFRVIGQIEWLRESWLNIVRWVLLVFPVSVWIRDMLMWDIATYILGESFKSNVLLRSGPRLIAGMDDQINRFALFYPNWKDYLWEPQTLRLALQLQPKDGNTIIAGAHIGYHALHLAQDLQIKDGLVFALEPVSNFYKQLVCNRDLSLLHNLITEQLALGSQSKEEITLNVAGMRSSVDVPLAGQASLETVRCITLDDFALRHRIKSVSMIFLDIEGSELNVLNGAASLLIYQPDLILEINRSGLESQGQSPKDLYRFLYERGYSLFFIHDDYSFTLGGYDPTNIILQPIMDEDYSPYPNVRVFNILATCRIEKIKQKGINVLDSDLSGEFKDKKGNI